MNIFWKPGTGSKSRIVREDMQCIGKITYMKFFLEELSASGGTSHSVAVIRLDSEPTEHYTNTLRIQKQLFQAFRQNSIIHLVTESCRSGDRGFSAFEIIRD